MPKQHIIPTERSPDLTTFTIKVEGVRITASVLVEAITVYREVNRVPTARLVIIDGDPANQTFAVSESETFIPGKSIEILAGYHATEQLIFKGIVTRQNIKTRSNRFLLVVECKDPAYKMTLVRRSKTFHDQKDSDVMAEIIGGYEGLQSEVSASLGTRAEIVQYDVTDWDFIQVRAEANGLLCFVQDGKVKIAAPDFDQDPVVEPVFGASILEFDGEMDGRTQAESVNAITWDHSSQEIAEAEANAPSIEQAGNLSAENIAAAAGMSQLVIRHAGHMKSDELQQHADAEMMRRQLAKLRGRVKFQGTAVVLPGKLMELHGLGARFNGKVLITGVTHEIAEGNWFSNVQFGLSSERFAEVYDIHPPRAAGRYAAVNGLSTGIVRQLAGDPDSEDRIRVHLPALNDGDQGIWARLATLDAGDGRGAFFRPEIDDEVIVGFLNDDPNNPVVLGMVHSSAKPTPEALSDDNHIKGFVTRSKIKMQFDDDKKSLKMETPAGKTVELDEQSGAITIKDENGNKITMEASGITVSASGNLTLKAGGILEIKGSLVKIN